MNLQDFFREHQMIRMTVVLSIITIGFISAIFGLSMLMQVHGQETELCSASDPTAKQCRVNNSTGKEMLDKFIEDTKRDISIDKAYRTEIINRIVNSTCESKDMIRVDGISRTTKELETELRTCISLGAIK
jgi:hypothetical protein